LLNKCRYLAFAEAATHGIINIYDLKPNKDKGSFSGPALKKKTLATTSISNSTPYKYVALSFKRSQEDKILAALTDQNNIIIWEWDKGRATEITDTNKKGLDKVNLMFFYPPDDCLVLLGKNSQNNHVMKVFNIKLEKQEVIVTQRNDAKKETSNMMDYTMNSYAFIEDPTTNQTTVIFGASSPNNPAKLFLLNKNFELRGLLEGPPGVIANDFIINCIHPSQGSGRGFFIAGNNKKLFEFEEGKEPKNPFVRKEKAIHNRAYDNISVNALCQLNEEYLLAGLKDGRLIKIKLNSERSGGTDGYEFSHLVYPFHSDTINDLDVAVMKPLVATCAKDKYIKIWNYINKSWECEAQFEDEPRLLSFHPSGFHLAVAFSNKVRLLNVRIGELKQYHEMNEKSCSAIAYSNGGQYFAIAKNTNVHIYSSYTGENMSNLTLKDDGNTITRIIWQLDDLKLFTLSNHIIEWSIDQDKLDKIVVHKNQILPNGDIGNCFDVTNLPRDSLENCLVGNTKDNSIVTVNLRREEKNRDKEGGLETKKQAALVKTVRQTGAPISALKFSNDHRILMMGTGQLGVAQPGTLRIYKYPLTGAVTEMQLHSRAITKICIARSDGMAFTIGEDNIFTMIRLAWDKLTSELPPLPFAVDVLVKKEDYITQIKNITSLNMKLKDAQENTKRRNEILEKRKREQEKEESKNLAIQKKEGLERIQEINKKIEEMEKFYDKKLEELRENNKKMIHDYERENERKIEEEGRKYDGMNARKIENEARQKKEEEMLKERHKEEIKRVKEEHAAIILAEQQEMAKLAQKRNEIRELHEKAIKKVEDEADQKIERSRRKFDSDMRVLENDCYKQDNQLKELIQKYSEEDNSNLKTQENLNNLVKTIQDINSNTQNERNRKRNLEIDIEERDDTIRKKNDRTKELERKTQELEKFKFVLKYKIGELRRDIGPREQEIAKMKEQLEVMRSETKEFKRTNAHLVLFVCEFGLQLRGIRNEIAAQESKINENATYINAFESEISELCGTLDKKEGKIEKVVVQLTPGSQEESDRNLQQVCCWRQEDD